MNENIGVSDQLELLTKIDRFDEEFLEFYKEIIKLQQVNKAQVDIKKLSESVKIDDIKQRLSTGQPLIDNSNLLVDQEFVGSMFHELVKLTKNYRRQTDFKGMRKLKTALADNKFVLIPFLKNFVFEKQDYFRDLAETIEVKPAWLIFVARTISLPLLEAHRDVLQPEAAASDSVWFRPFCPTCGSAPAMTRLEKEVGQRFLWCSICNTQWKFKRLQCPFCLTSDQDKLRYFFSDEDSPYRVDVCDNCKCYIKTIDERKLNEDAKVYMNIEDMKTIHLEETAAKEGFHNALWWMGLG